MSMNDRPSFASNGSYIALYPSMRLHNQKVILRLLILLCLFANSNECLAQMLCTDLFRSLSIQDFIFQRNLGQFPTSFTAEVPEVRIKKQCNLGACSPHALTTQLELLTLYHTGNHQRFSSHYLILNLWRDKAIKALNTRTLTDRITPSSDFFFTLSIVRKYGVLPERHIESPSPPFSTLPFSARVIEHVTQYVAEAITGMNNAKNINESEQIQLKAVTYLHQFFDQLMPKYSSDFNPVSYARRFVPEIYHRKAIAIKLNEVAEITMQASNDKIIEIEIARALPVIKSTIDSGRSVYLSFENNKAFARHAHGLLTMNPLINTAQKPLTQSQQKNFKTPARIHAVQIVGYNLDQHGNLIGFKIQNSYGSKSGVNGYYYMDINYFKAFAKYIAIFDSFDVEIPKANTSKQLEFPF